MSMNAVVFGNNNRHQELSFIPLITLTLFFSLSFSLSLFLHPSLSSITPVGLLNYILWPHISDVNKFLLLSQQWRAHM